MGVLQREVILLLQRTLTKLVSFPGQGYGLKVKAVPVLPISLPKRFYTQATVKSGVSGAASDNIHAGAEDRINPESTSYIEFQEVHLEKIPDWKSRISKSMLVFPDFVTEEEEKNIMLEIEPYISRLQYETSHWDDAIHHYRETERKSWSKKNTVIINRIRDIAFPPSVPQLQLVHVLDLAKKGRIKPHVDSVRFCGNTIAGLSLLSDSVMRLRHEVHKDHALSVYLPRFSLYVMNDIARYEFTHEILGEEESAFRRKVVARDRRISIMCRNEPELPPEEGLTTWGRLESTDNAEQQNQSKES